MPGERDDQRGCGSFGILIGLLGLLADAAADAAWGANPAGAKQLKSQRVETRVAPSSSKYTKFESNCRNIVYILTVHVFNHWFDMV